MLPQQAFAIVHLSSFPCQLRALANACVLSFFAVAVAAVFVVVAAAAIKKVGLISLTHCRR